MTKLGFSPAHACFRRCCRGECKIRGDVTVLKARMGQLDVHDQPESWQSQVMLLSSAVHSLVYDRCHCHERIKMCRFVYLRLSVLTECFSMQRFSPHKESKFGYPSRNELPSLIQVSPGSVKGLSDSVLEFSGLLYEGVRKH